MVFKILKFARIYYIYVYKVIIVLHTQENRNNRVFFKNYVPLHEICTYMEMPIEALVTYQLL